MEFKLQSDFVELDNLLKAVSLAASGAEAKLKIRTGAVRVNGEVEPRVRRKLRAGDTVELEGARVTIV